MPLLRASNLEISYGPDSPAIVRDLSLTLAPGELVGIVGPNGSGKSTLLRTLSRALRPGKGFVMLHGLDLYDGTSARGAAREIGVVQQEAPIAFDFTVRDIVLMGRSPHISRRPFSSESRHDREVTEDAMRIAGVDSLADRPFAQLSGGERQRVVLARALAQEPAVILLDEPTAHLDLRHQREALTIIRDLSDKLGRAVLAVLHDLNLASAYCDRLILMKEGAVLAQGTVAEVITQQNVQRAYGANVWVRCHPILGRPVLITLPDLPVNIAEHGPAVHVICGGGSGTSLFVALRQKGINVTASVLNEGDTDFESATMLAIPFVREAPFSAISEAAEQEARRIGSDAEVVVVTDAPFGQANLANLKTARTLQCSGKPVLLLSDPDISERDFTGGEATKIWREMASHGALLCKSQQEILQYFSENPVLSAK
jgi:iron complex transport system ATP-binding protein